MPEQINNLYIHIPFCKSKCHYCNFVSFVDKENFIESYFLSLKKEIAFYFNKFNNINLKTVYIGGGTPSIIEVAYYREILELVRLKANIAASNEITLEVNPGTVNERYLRDLADIGFNRLSIGIQSFDNKTLKSVNRVHNKQEAMDTVNKAKAAGFQNIGIDLIYGLPGQTHENWQKELNEAVKLDINHISTYGLKIEEGTVFWKKAPQNLPDEETNAAIYLNTIDFLEKNGFKHYEISNFARYGFESKHNLCYWKNKEYLAAGVSAHGYIEGTRYSNTENLEGYIKNPLKKLSEHKVSPQEKLEEEIFLGLRLREGLNISELNKKHNIDFCSKYKNVLSKFSLKGLFLVEDELIKLKKEGILVSNEILCEFLS